MSNNQWALSTHSSTFCTHTHRRTFVLKLLYYTWATRRKLSIRLTMRSFNLISNESNEMQPYKEQKRSKPGPHTITHTHRTALDDHDNVKTREWEREKESVSERERTRAREKERGGEKTFYLLFTHWSGCAPTLSYFVGLFSSFMRSIEIKYFHNLVKKRKYISINQKSNESNRTKSLRFAHMFCIAYARSHIPYINKWK